MNESEFDVVVVGAGPSGLGAAAHAQANGLSCILLERAEHLADTIHCYQKKKHVMAEPSLVPLRGEVPFEAGTRESILEGWQSFVEWKELNVAFQQEVAGLEKTGDMFVVKTQTDEYRCRNVILAIGTQGNPRTMGCPGEDMPHVVTRLVDPDEFEDRDIVVVGAGDSALEIALGLCDNNRVSLIVRKPELARAKDSLIAECLTKANTGQMQIFYSATVKLVEEGFVELNGAQEDIRLEADQIFVKIGAFAPRGLLEGFGVQFTSEDRAAKPVLSSVNESTVPGLFLIGATTGRDLIKFGMNQGYEVVEHLLGNEVEPADEELLAERLPFWQGSVRQRLIQLMEQVPLIGAVAESEGEGGEEVDRSAESPQEELERMGAASELLREGFLTVEPHTYLSGDVIMRQNDYTNSVLVIISGAVAINYRDEAGTENEVAQLGPSEFFGEMGLVSGRRRNATATAIEETQILEIPRKAMLNLIYSSRGVKRIIDRTFLIRAFQSYLFPQLTADELRPLVEGSESRDFEKREAIFEEGDPGDALYLIRNGQVKLSRMSGDREVVLTYLVAGNYFGEAALVADIQRSATATAIFPTKIIRVAKDDFAAFLAEHPHADSVIRQKLDADRLRSLKYEATPGAGRLLGELIREEVVMGTDALIIDQYKCVRCSNCLRACEDVHEDGQSRLSLTGKSFANILSPNSCWQCENPMCMLDCPPDALYRDADGEIHIKNNCIGCGNCEANCPYGNVFMVKPQPKLSLLETAKMWITRAKPEKSTRSVAVKCDLCSDIKGGPACVRSCPTGAAVRVKADDFQHKIEEILIHKGPM